MAPPSASHEDSATAGGTAYTDGVEDQLHDTIQTHRKRSRPGDVVRQDISMQQRFGTGDMDNDGDIDTVDLM